MFCFALLLSKSLFTSWDRMAKHHGESGYEGSSKEPVALPPRQVAIGMGLVQCVRKVRLDICFASAFLFHLLCWSLLGFLSGLCVYFLFFRHARLNPFKASFMKSLSSSVFADELRSIDLCLTGMMIFSFCLLLQNSHTSCCTFLT